MEEVEVKEVMEVMEEVEVNVSCTLRPHSSLPSPRHPYLALPGLTER